MVTKVGAIEEFDDEDLIQGYEADDEADLNDLRINAENLLDKRNKVLLSDDEVTVYGSIDEDIGYEADDEEAAENIDVPSGISGVASNFDASYKIARRLLELQQKIKTEELIAEYAAGSEIELKEAVRREEHNLIFQKDVSKTAAAKVAGKVAKRSLANPSNLAAGFQNIGNTLVDKLGSVLTLLGSKLFPVKVPTKGVGLSKPVVNSKGPGSSELQDLVKRELEKPAVQPLFHPVKIAGGNALHKEQESLNLDIIDSPIIRNVA